MKSGEKVYYLEKPFMYDSFKPIGFKSNQQVNDIPESSISYNIQMNLVERGSQYYIDIVPDQKWLTDPSRVWPVTIDPSIVYFQPSSSGIDTNIRSYFPNTTGGADLTLGAGLYQDSTQSNIIRGLMLFDLSSIPRGSTILSGELNLWLASVANNTSIGVQVHELKKSWGENYATWNNSNSGINWASPGGDFISTPTDTNQISYLTDLSVNYRWDITSLVDKWNKSPSTNYGIILKSNSESTNTYKKFISSDDLNNINNHPMLAVTYYPSSRLGLENYWDYNSHNLVNGQASINITTGNNVIQYQDLSLKGRGGMGVNFVRTYNSKAINDSEMGFGWSYTGGETIYEREDHNQAVFTDSDGTAHVFVYNPSTKIYTSPEGLYLKLSRTTDTNGTFNGYDLTYKDGIVLHFNKNWKEYSNITIGKLQFIQDRHGNKVSFIYNSNGQIVNINDPSGRKTILNYYSSGRISSITDFAGRKTNYGYDSQGNLTIVDNYTDAINYRRTQMVYDQNHNLLTIIDPNGRKTDFTYNNEAVQKVQEPYGEGSEIDLSTRPSTNYLYDLPNYVSKITDRKGNITTYNCDSNYVVTKITDPLGRVTSYTLDQNYNPTEIKDPKGNIAYISYDSNGNITSEKNPEGHTIIKTYDSFSNLTSLTDALGNKTTYEYNSFGDLITVINPKQQKTIHTYDMYGNRTSKTDANGNKTNYVYDSNGINQTSVTDATGRITNMEYDSADNLIKIIEPNGQITNLQYNWVDQLEMMDQKTSDSASPQLSYDPTYDNNGNITSVVDTLNSLSNTTNYDFTPTNDVKSQAINSAQQINYQYDPNQNLTDWILQSNWGHSLQFSYDSANQLQNVVDTTNQTLIEKYNYDLNGNISSIDRINADGVSQSMIYDKANRLTNLQNIKGSTVLSSFTYTPDANGRIVSIIDKNGLSTTYNYDEVGRLSNYTNQTGTTSYTFDGVGNRLTKTTPNGVTEYTYNNLNQLVGRNGEDGNAIYQYNDKGELIDINGTHFEWDTDGNIIKVTKPDGLMIEFIYNAKGQRTEKIVKNNIGSIISHYKYDYDDQLESIVAETNILANKIITYSYDSTGRRISQSQDGNIYYYNYDGHGNVVGLTNSAGDFVTTYSYDPWGQLITKTGTLYNPFTYSGYYYDEEINLYHLINRFYDPIDGRFLSQDAFEPVDGNLYVYANNDPINFYDPDGNLVFAIPLAVVFVQVIVDGVAIGIGLYLAQNKKTAKKAIDSLEKQIKDHKDKIKKNPKSTARKHWEKEIKAFQDQINKLKKRWGIK